MWEISLEHAAEACRRDISCSNLRGQRKHAILRNCREVGIESAIYEEWNRQTSLCVNMLFYMVGIIMIAISKYSLRIKFLAYSQYWVKVSCFYIHYCIIPWVVSREVSVFFQCITPCLPPNRFSSHSISCLLYTLTSFL